MAYKDLFVDFDDTIYDTHGNAEISLAELFDDFGLQRYFGSLEEFTDPYWKTNRELWAQYSKGDITRDYLIVERFRRPLSCGKGLNPDVEYCLKMSDRFLDLCSVKPGLVEGARELLEYLRPKYRMHLCSNGFHEVQYKKLNASDTMKYFDTIILSEDAGVNKPQKGFFDYAFRMSGADAAHTLMIGDNLTTDILGAMAAGLDALYFNPENKPDEEQVKYRVSRLTDIMKIL